MERLDDDDLLQALRRQDAAATESLIAAYGSRSYRMATRILGNAQDAEEVVQDAMWTVVAKIDTFRGDSAFSSWVYRIVANAAYNKVRSVRTQRREISLDGHDDTAIDSAVRINDPSLQTDLRMMLRAAIAELPPDYRTALVMRDVEGLSNLEISAALRISVTSVKSRVHRARVSARKAWNEIIGMMRKDSSVSRLPGL